LVIPLAIAATRDDGRSSLVVGKPRTSARGATAGGPVSLLVGVDGSAGSRGALAKAVGLVGPQLGRLTIATVIDHDDAVAARTGARVAIERAEQILDDAASFAGVPCETVVLTGRPADALVEYARGKEVDVLVLGSHGTGLSAALLGSTTTGALHARDLTTLVVGADSRRAMAHDVANSEGQGLR
jgi:nucleotide-binding universal stress UspA family protein